MKTIITIIIALALLLAIASCTSESGRRARAAQIHRESISYSPPIALDTTLIRVSRAGDRLYLLRYYTSPHIDSDELSVYIVENKHGEIVLVER